MIYSLLVSLLILLLSASAYGLYLLLNLFRVRERNKVASKEWDLEACTKLEKVNNKPELPAVARPPLAYFTLRSSRHASSRILRNPVTLGIRQAPSIDDTASKPDSTVGTASPDTAPARPPRPTHSDDFLTSFSYPNAIASDVWFPVANKDTGHWDLCVVNATVTIASLGGCSTAEVNPPSSHARSTNLGKWNPSKTVFYPDKAKRKQNGCKRRRGTCLPALEIPELYVNARSFDEIEAQQIPTNSDDRSYLEEEYDTNFLYPTYGLCES